MWISIIQILMTFTGYFKFKIIMMLNFDKMLNEYKQKPSTKDNISAFKTFTQMPRIN